MNPHFDILLFMTTERDREIIAMLQQEGALVSNAMASLKHIDSTIKQLASIVVQEQDNRVQKGKPTDIWTQGTREN